MYRIIIDNYNRKSEEVVVSGRGGGGIAKEDIYDTRRGRSALRYVRCPLSAAVMTDFIPVFFTHVNYAFRAQNNNKYSLIPNPFPRRPYKQTTIPCRETERGRADPVSGGQTRHFEAPCC